MRTESELEKYFCEHVRAAGGETEKFVSVGKRGVPDRIVYWQMPFSSTRVDFVELKRPRGGRYSKLQDVDIEWRSALGLRVYRLRTVAEIDYYVDMCK